LVSFAGSRPRFAAIVGNSSAVLRRLLRVGASSSRMIRKVSNIRVSLTRLRFNGGAPVSSSKSSTPSA
jgi:hypothetical protein